MEGLILKPPVNKFSKVREHSRGQYVHKQREMYRKSKAVIMNSTLLYTAIYTEHTYGRTLSLTYKCKVLK